MGNAASGDEGRHRLGYHVLRVKEESPAAAAGIRPFFDYIVGINGIRLNKESTELQDQMLANEGKKVVLDIYSTREQAGRRIEMVPTTQWGDGKAGLLGCSIRFCMFDAANDVVWHVLDVYQGSPAERAGFCAHSDYIIGTPYGIMRGESDLYDLIEDNAGEALRLYVYNAETDHVREVIIVPNYDWGGEGLLGCDVGYGYLHRLPRGPVGPLSQEGGNAALKRSPSLPYPATSSSSSQDPTLANEGYTRNTMPATFGNHSPNGANSDILAPTPRPTQPPTWLNPEQHDKLSNMTTPRNTLDFYQEGQEGEEKKPLAEGGQDELNQPPLLRFGKGNRPDADEDESDEEEFVPRHEPPTSVSNVSTQSTQPAQQQLSQQELAAGVAGLAIHGVPQASINTSTQAISPLTSTSLGAATTAATGPASPIRERGNVDVAPLSSPPGSTIRDAHPAEPHQNQPQHPQQHHPHYPPHPVMTRFHGRPNPGTTPPPSAAALESPFQQALLHQPHPNQPSAEGQGAAYPQEKKHLQQQQQAQAQQPSQYRQPEEEINFGDIPFGAGEQQQRQAPQEKPKEPSPRAHRREQSLGMGVRTKHQMEPEARIPVQTVIAQAQSQSEEYRRAMEQYSQQFR
ncbi:Golgi reassembly-stacking protein 2 [Actinomortierella ambigua]|nr:Golgi reassembly-stacking protein 2 [Actinomortierella ambigua]